MIKNIKFVIVRICFNIKYVILNIKFVIVRPPFSRIMRAREDRHKQTLSITEIRPLSGLGSRKSERKQKGKRQKQSPFEGAEGVKRKREENKLFYVVYTNKYKKCVLFHFYKKISTRMCFLLKIKCYICSKNPILSICR